MEDGAIVGLFWRGCGDAMDFSMCGVVSTMKKCCGGNDFCSWMSEYNDFLVIFVMISSE